MRLQTGAGPTPNLDSRPCVMPSGLFGPALCSTGGSNTKYQERSICSNLQVPRQAVRCMFRATMEIPCGHSPIVRNKRFLQPAPARDDHSCAVDLEYKDRSVVRSLHPGITSRSMSLLGYDRDHVLAVRTALQVRYL